MKKSLFLVFILCQNILIFSQKPAWTSHFTGAGENYPYQSAIDNNDNLYVVGFFKGSVNQSPGQGITKTLISKGDYDVFVSKYDNTGKLIWIRQIGGTLGDFAATMTRDNQNQEIWIGVYSTSATLTDEDNNLITNASAGGQEEVILISLSYSDGSFRVKKRVCLDSYRHRITNMRLDSAKRVIITGYFNTRIKFSATDSSTATALNGFVARFDRNGNYIKHKLIDGPTSQINSISILDKSTYVLSGRVATKLKIGTDSILNPAGNLNDILLFKIDTNLNYIPNTFRKIGGTGQDLSLSVSNDKNRNTYISGYFASTYLVIDSTATQTTSRGSVTVPINKGGNDFVFALYDSLFNLKWLNYGGTAGDDQMSKIASNDNSIMIAGRFGAPKLVFKNDSITNGGSTDGLTIVMDKYNNLVYLLGFGATGAEVIETGQITSTGDFIVVGRFTSPQLIFNNDTLINPNADKDMVIVKYSKASLNMWVNQIVCPGANDGSVAAIPKGTTMAPYTYAWTKKGDPTFNSTEQYIYNLSAGTYYVDFHDNLGFTTTDSAVLVNPGTTAVSVTVDSVKNTTCYSGSDGKIYITANNGYPGYSYSWIALSGSGVIPTAQDQTTLSLGSYKVTVTDSKGCKTTSNNVGVSEPAQITLSPTISDVTVVGGSDGSIIMNVTNGVPAFTYAWTKTGDISFTASVKDISSLEAGIYNLLVTDSKGCTANGSATVRDPDELAVSLTATPVSCKNANDGILVATIPGNPPGLTYTWTNIIGDPSFVSTNNDTITGLKPGTYKVDVTDGVNNGSNQTDVTEPVEFKITNVTITDIDCYGTASGSIDVTVTGGILPYNYTWTRTGEPGYSASSANLIEVIAGTYNYTATDTRGCIADSIITIDQTDSMLVTAQIQPVSCSGEIYDGYIHQTVTGGNPGYTFLWSNGLNIKDIDFLRPGAYYCTLKDSKNCSNTKRYIIDEPGTFYGNFIIKNISCFGDNDGSIEIKITGGNAPYTYQWKAPLTDTVAKLDSIGEGIFTVTVKDSKKCESIFVMPTSITEPDSLVLAIDSLADENLGLDGLIQASATGGVSPYNFLLLPVGTNNATGLFNTLAANKYILYLSDKNLCGPVKSDTLTILPNPLDLKSLSELYSASVYPNPNNGIFTLLIYGTNSEYKITMVNTTGQVVMEKMYYSKDFLSEINMNVSQLAKGIYFLKINNSSSVKVLIQ